MSIGRIVVVGSTMIDLVAFAERLPESGETVVGARFLQGFGGKGANQAVMAARFGADVAMVGAVGDDANGRAIVDNLRAQGVVTGDITIVDGTSGVAPIWVDETGMNRIIVIPGANALLQPDAAAAAVERLAPVVVVGQFEIPQAATAAAFGAARRGGAITILNPAPGAPVDPQLLGATDWLVPNETEFRLIGGQALGNDPITDPGAIEELGDRLQASLVVTVGERGVILRPLGGPARTIPARAARAVDTTGAGDAFVGAFAVGLASRWTPDAAARLGCLAAADSVTRPGAQASFADRKLAGAWLSRLIQEGSAGAS